MITTKQNGFGIIGALVGFLAVSIIAGAGFYVFGKINDDKDTQKSESTSSNTQEVAQKKTEPKIKHLGVDLGTYDPATNKAGAFEFTREVFSAGERMQMLFMDYGFVIPGTNRADGKESANPQPTFILPLGTKVYSLVDGTVFEVPKLYSNDYSVQVQAEGSELIFETEHVINVLVHKGDKVKAGDVIAEVSDYSTHGYAGFGLVEIGVLQGGNPPSHLCPFEYLDESIKASTFEKITALQKAWEEYRGDTSIYDESKAAMPGCVSTAPIEG